MIEDKMRKSVDGLLDLDINTRTKLIVLNRFMPNGKRKKALFELAKYVFEIWTKDGVVIEYMDGDTRLKNIVSNKAKDFIFQKQYKGDDQLNAAYVCMYATSKAKTSSQMFDLANKALYHFCDLPCEEGDMIEVALDIFVDAMEEK